MEPSPTTQDDSQRAFTEYFAFLEGAKKIVHTPLSDARLLTVAYMQLAESYEKLLKTAVRIARMGDRAQNKLLKYKELMDTLRNID